MRIWRWEDIYPTSFQAFYSTPTHQRKMICVIQDADTWLLSLTWTCGKFLGSEWFRQLCQRHEKRKLFPSFLLKILDIHDFKKFFNEILHGMFYWKRKGTCDLKDISSRIPNFAILIIGKDPISYFIVNLNKFSFFLLSPMSLSPSTISALHFQGISMVRRDSA